MELVTGSNVEMVQEKGTGWDKMKQREGKKKPKTQKTFLASTFEIKCQSFASQGGRNIKSLFSLQNKF